MFWYFLLMFFAIFSTILLVNITLKDLHMPAIMRAVPWTEGAKLTNEQLLGKFKRVLIFLVSLLWAFILVY